MDTQEPIQGQQPEHPITHEPRYWLITALAVVATALVFGGGVWWWMNGQLADLRREAVDLEKQVNWEDSVAVSDADNQSASAEGWETYQNDDIGFSFEYPPEFNLEVTNRDTTNNGNMGTVFSGKNVRLTFNDGEIWFSASTQDYSAFKDISYTGKNPVSCASPFQFSLGNDACKEITIDGADAIFRNALWSDECAIGFFSHVPLRNPNPDSEYTGIEFNVSFDDINKQLESLYSCLGASAPPAFDAAVVQQSSNIMNDINLSDADQQRLDTFNAILSTVHFQ